MLEYSLEQEFKNPNLEASVILAVTESPRRFFEVKELLHPSAFTGERQNAWEEISLAITAGKALPKDLPPGKPAADVIEAARALEDLRLRREAARALEPFLEQLQKPGHPAREIINKAITGLTAIDKECLTGKVLYFPEALLEAEKAALERAELLRKTGREFIGLPTGIKGYDSCLGGLQEGIHLLAAEPGKGKTTLALQVALNVAKTGTPVLFVTFEESVERLTIKAICNLANLKAKGYFNGRGNPNDLSLAIREYREKLGPLGFLAGNSRLEVSTLKANLLQMMNQFRAKECLVVVDYLQKWARGRKGYAEFRHNVGSLAAELRELARDLKIPIFAIVSQNRPGQDSSSLTSLKESGDLEYDADTVSFLTGEPNSAPKPGTREISLVIGKNRFGETSKFEMVFELARGRFVEVEGCRF
jgi:replicative DNA helicase